MAMDQQMAAGREVRLAAKGEQPRDIGTGRREPVGPRLDHVVKTQRQPVMRREGRESRGVGPVRVEDRQDMRHPGGAMLVELRYAADRQPEWREGAAGGSHLLSFMTEVLGPGR